VSWSQRRRSRRCSARLAWDLRTGPWTLVQLNLTREIADRELTLHKYGVPATEPYARDHLGLIAAHPETAHLSAYTSPFVERIAALMAAGQ
jgi:hypothetical protein